MKRIVISLLASMVTLFAFVNMASACAIFGYQPEVPAKLKK
ncbi:cyclic lactone autoinducer peptide [Bacillota bacterium LX-D]|nr:cyclic lactone autoinducer peptide [Bacillota bacterium LX-D]